MPAIGTTSHGAWPRWALAGSPGGIGEHPRHPAGGVSSPTRRPDSPGNITHNGRWNVTRAGAQVTGPTRIAHAATWL